ncbi:hypothetical protein ADIAL_1779 [Alkalibacterium sp. AK22]|nr:hypothetical protein ADIAL_1779 [Alkalibacterium sp. AK22]
MATAKVDLLPVFLKSPLFWRLPKQLTTSENSSKKHSLKEIIRSDCAFCYLSNTV